MLTVLDGLGGLVDLRGRLRDPHSETLLLLPFAHVVLVVRAVKLFGGDHILVSKRTSFWQGNTAG